MTKHWQSQFSIIRDFKPNLRLRCQHCKSISKRPIRNMGKTVWNTVATTVLLSIKCVNLFNTTAVKVHPSRWTKCIQPVCLPLFCVTSNPVVRFFFFIERGHFCSMRSLWLIHISLFSVWLVAGSTIMTEAGRGFGSGLHKAFSVSVVNGQNWAD